MKLYISRDRESNETIVVLPLETATGNRVEMRYPNARLYGAICNGLVWSDVFPVRTGYHKGE